MHYVNAKSILSNKNGMNLYRGCSHGCIYCDSRSNVYNMDHAFEDIEVKANATELLKKALKNKKEKVMIGTGSMTDPYIPLERKIQSVRESLELINKYGHGFTCITKSNLILRDLDLLKEINEKAKVVIQMTLTTYDENIPTIVWLCPILPFINDTEENINGILDYCIDANVKGIICFGMGMTLRDGNMEYFYSKLDKHFPGLKEKYIRTYGNSYGIASPNQKELMKIFYKRTNENNMMNNPEEIFTYLHEFPSKDKTKQTTLF